MTERTLAAALAGIILGVFFGYQVPNSNYAGIGVFFFACIFCPLVVALIADERAILLAMVPNPILVMTWLIVEEIQQPEVQHFGIQTIAAIFLFAIPSLLVSVPVHLIRKVFRK